MIRLHIIEKHLSELKIFFLSFLASIQSKMIPKKYNLPKLTNEGVPICDLCGLSYNSLSNHIKKRHNISSLKFPKMQLVRDTIKKYKIMNSKELAEKLPHDFLYDISALSTTKNHYLRLYKWYIDDADSVQ